MVGSVNLVAPLLIPPKLLLRALDDLHTIATVAQDTSRRLDRLEATLDEALALGHRIESIGGDLLGMAGRMDRRAVAMLNLGERIDARADAVLALGEKVDARGRQLVDEGRLMQERAREVTDRAGELVEALPLLERALGLAMPLEGAVERLGRVADRLPGGRAAAGRGKPRDDA